MPGAPMGGMPGQMPGMMPGQPGMMPGQAGMMPIPAGSPGAMTPPPGRPGAGIVNKPLSLRESVGNTRNLSPIAAATATRSINAPTNAANRILNRNRQRTVSEAISGAPATVITGAPGQQPVTGRQTPINQMGMVPGQQQPAINRMGVPTQQQPPINRMGVPTQQGVLAGGLNAVPMAERAGVPFGTTPARVHHLGELKGMVTPSAAFTSAANTNSRLEQLESALMGAGNNPDAPLQRIAWLESQFGETTGTVQERLEQLEQAALLQGLI